MGSLAAHRRYRHPCLGGNWVGSQRIALLIGIYSGAFITGLWSITKHRTMLLCDIAAGLTERDLDVSLPVLIISKDEVLVDEARPLRSLLAGLSGIHLAGHADQLRGLRTMSGGG